MDVIVVHVIRWKDELEDIPDSESRRRMRLYEKMGDAASELDCYEAALEHYQNMVW